VLPTDTKQTSSATRAEARTAHFSGSTSCVSDSFRLLVGHLVDCSNDRVFAVRVGGIDIDGAVVVLGNRGEGNGLGPVGDPEFGPLQRRSASLGSSARSPSGSAQRAGEQDRGSFRRCSQLGKLSKADGRRVCCAARTCGELVARDKLRGHLDRCPGRPTPVHCQLSRIATTRRQ
jgi:hypothetical protein